MRSKQAVAVLICVLGLSVFSGSAFARSDIGFKGIGFRVGLVDPADSYNATVGLGALADLGTFAKDVHWNLGLYYWQSSLEHFYEGYYNRDWTLRDFAIKSDVTYHFSGHDLEPYLGGGLGIHFFSWDFRYPPNYPYRYDAGSTELGLQVVAGLEHRFDSRWTGHAQFEYDFTDIDQLHILIGAVYMLGH